MPLTPEAEQNFLNTLSERNRKSVESAYKNKSFINDIDWLTHHKISHHEYPKFLDAYHILLPIIEKNLDPKLQQASVLKPILRSQGLSEEQIKNVMRHRQDIMPYIDAELGRMPRDYDFKPDGSFEDEYARALFLKAKGIPEHTALNQPIDTNTTYNHQLDYDTEKKIFGELADTRRKKDEDLKRAEEQKLETIRKAEEEEQKRRTEARKPLGRIPNLTQNELSSDATHGPKWHQEARKAALQYQIDLINKPYLEYIDPRLAKLSPKEIESRMLHEGLNPHKAENRKILNEVEQGLRTAAGSKKSETAAAPFLNASRKDLRTLHEDLYEDIENKYEKSVRDKAFREWNEKYAPSIKQKYLTPGVKGHGHIAKEVGEAAERFERGVEDSLSAHRAQNRAQSIQAAQGEKEAAIKGAHIAGMNAKEDALHNLEATKALQDAHTADQLQKRAHAEQQRALGREERGLEQKQLDLNYEAFKDAKNEQEDRLKTLHGMTTATPVSEFRTRMPTEPTKPESDLYNTASNLFIGAGRDLLGRNVNHKKGDIVKPKRLKKAGGGLIASNHLSPTTQAKLLGTIHSYKRLASGGEANTDYIQDAVFDGVLPSSELRHKMRTSILNKAKEDFDHRTRNYLATGGQVNPIAEGVKMAQDLVAREKNIKNQELQLREQVLAERQRAFTPQVEEKENPLISALDAGMAAAAESGGDNFLAHAGKAWSGAAKNIEAKKAIKHQKQKEHREYLSKLAEQMHTERYHELGRELEREKLGALKSHYGAQEAHWKSMENLAKSKQDQKNGFTSEGISIDDLPTRPQTEKDKNIISKSSSAFENVPTLLGHLNKLSETVKKVKSGEWVGKANKVLGANITSAIPGIGSGVKANDLLDLQSQAATVFSNYQHLEKILGESQGGKLALALQSEHESMPNSSKTPEENIRITGELYNKLYNTVDGYKKKLVAHGGSKNRIKEADDMLATIRDFQHDLSQPIKEQGIHPAERSAMLAEMEKRRPANYGEAR